jgi:hypothetical protein
MPALTNTDRIRELEFRTIRNTENIKNLEDQYHKETRDCFKTPFWQSEPAGFSRIPGFCNSL